LLKLKRIDVARINVLSIREQKKETKIVERKY
jgi:hypothetical protein